MKQDSDILQGWALIISWVKQKITLDREREERKSSDSRENRKKKRKKKSCEGPERENLCLLMKKNHCGWGGRKEILVSVFVHFQKSTIKIDKELDNLNYLLNTLQMIGLY